jgi:hypothetical protein
MSTTVWFDATREHFWRIPDAEVLDEGDLELRALTGERRSVDPDRLAAWALTREQARWAIAEELRDAAKHAGRAIGSVAQDAWSDATSALPDEWSWAELERRMGPMDTWLDELHVKETVEAGREQVQRTARQARDTWRRASRVAGSAVRSARTIGKVVLDNPELAERASKLAEAVARAGEGLKRHDDGDA